MKKIEKLFLTKTIPDCLDEQYGISYIKFVFDEKTLDELSDSLKNELEEGTIDEKMYLEGLKSILFLRKNCSEYKNGSDDIFIEVHDSNQFFSYLQELIDLYARRSNHALIDPNNFIRSIWLRMGTEDIKNVEDFLRKQKVFIKNEGVLKEYNEFAQLNDGDYTLAYRINENEDWFETNKNIVFSIMENNLANSDLSFDSLIDLPDESKKYDFPAVHFAFARENNRPTAFLYGIQQVSSPKKDDSIREYIQPIRRQLRNKHVSADILISLSLFFDFLYNGGIKDVIIPTMQVFNYQFHEQLSNNYHIELDKYSEEEKQKIEERYNNGDRSKEVIEYINLKIISQRYMDRQDDISYNKSERLIYSILELSEKYPVLDITSYPFIEDENMHIRINGEINLLNSYSKRRTI